MSRIASSNYRSVSCGVRARMSLYASQEVCTYRALDVKHGGGERDVAIPLLQLIGARIVDEVRGDRIDRSVVLVA